MSISIDYRISQWNYFLFIRSYDKCDINIDCMEYMCMCIHFQKLWCLQNISRKKLHDIAYASGIDEMCSARSPDGKNESMNWIPEKIFVCNLFKCILIKTHHLSIMMIVIIIETLLVLFQSICIVWVGFTRIFIAKCPDMMKKNGFCSDFSIIFALFRSSILKLIHKYGSST